MNQTSLVIINPVGPPSKFRLVSERVMPEGITDSELLQELTRVVCQFCDIIVNSGKTALVVPTSYAFRQRVEVTDNLGRLAAVRDFEFITYSIDQES